MGKVASLAQSQRDRVGLYPAVAAGFEARPVSAHAADAPSTIPPSSSALDGSIFAPPSAKGDLRKRFDRVRALSRAMVGGLSDADAGGQSMPDASPSKWHLAHTTWFFEAFVLCDFVRGYRRFDSRFAFLYNSYYESKGERLARSARGMLTRPSLDEILAYRRHVDAAMAQALNELPAAAQELVLLGCHHEEQHQELLLTDLLHLFAQNPLLPQAYAPDIRRTDGAADPLRWVEGRRGPIEIGHDGIGFAFDCEGPRHTVWLAPHALADRLVTNSEWQRFHRRRRLSHREPVAVGRLGVGARE